MSAQPSGGSSQSPVASMIFGTIIFVSTVAGWLYASPRGIDCTVLWSVATTVIGALFLAQPIGRAANSASQAALQTNGQLGDRVEAALTTALQKRDTAQLHAQAAITPPPLLPAPDPSLTPTT